MYTTGGLFFPNFSGQEMKPRHNLVIHEDLFLYEYTRFLLHKRLVVEGLLSPYANPFYLPMDTVHRETTNDIEWTETEHKDIDKQTIASKLHKKAEDIKLQEEITDNNKNFNDNINNNQTLNDEKLPNEIEWIQVGKSTALEISNTKLNEYEISERKN